MPLSCSHCGAQNADGMRFCQFCGSPLTPAATTPEPAAPPAPAPAIPPVRGPVYQPAPRHRLPFGTIVGIMVGVLGLLAAIGILTSHRGPVPPLALPTTVPPTLVPAQPTQIVPPTLVPAQPTQIVPPTTVPAQPTQAVQPTLIPAQPTQASQPTSTAVTQPSGPTSTGQTLSTTTFSVFVPSQWQVSKQSTNPSQNEVVLQDPSTAPNGLDIFAGVSAASTNAQSVLQSVLTNLQQQYADAKQCGNTVQSTFGGVAGTLMPICFTITPQGGAATSVAELAWAATDPAGSTIYFVAQTAADTNQAFFTHAGEVTKTIRWGGSQ